MSKIFISYAHNDALYFIERLRGQLIQHGFDVFRDSHSIEPGKNWKSAIKKAIRNSACVLAVLTPGSVSSRWYDGELQMALDYDKAVIPLLVIECEIPLELRSVQHIDFTNPEQESFQTSFERLVEALNSILATPRELRSLGAESASEWRSLPVRDYAAHLDHAEKDEIQCITRDTSLAEAHAILDWANYRSRHLLVTSSGQMGDKLEGILSLRDISREMPNKRRELRARDVMHENKDQDHDPPYFLTIRDDASLQDALQKFTTPLNKAPAASHYFYMSAIPLVDDADQLTGIMSFNDILKLMDSGVIPVPDCFVNDIMFDLDRTNCGLLDDNISVTRMGLRRLGQRDVPVVNDFVENRLVGFVPDHILVQHYYDISVTLGDIMTPLERVHTQLPGTPVRELLAAYMSWEGAPYYTFPVIESEKNPILLGTVGYRNIFEHLLADR